MELIKRDWWFSDKRIEEDDFDRTPYVFQQDNAAAHRAHDMVELLRRETPAFIPPELWPANSPDLNPVDYSIWECVHQRVYQKPVNDVGQLKQSLTEIWSGVQQTVTFVDEATDEWRRRLRTCVRVAGTSFCTFVVISTVACLLLTLLSIHPVPSSVVQTDLVTSTTISYEWLEQSRWILHWISLAPTDDLVRFWRSKVKVTASRRGGEVIYFDAWASKSIF